MTTLIGIIGSAVLILQVYKEGLIIFIPWLAVGLVVFGLYWCRGRERGIDLDALFDTLPGVPSDEYDPDVDKPTAD